MHAGFHRDLLESKLRTNVSRRRFLSRAGSLLPVTLIGSALSVGCRASRTASPGKSTGGGKLGGVLNFFGYDGEDGASVAKPFLESHGIRLQTTFQSSADEALTRFQTGGRGAMDIVASNKDFHRAILASGVEFLLPLDMNRIPNADGLFPAFKNAPWLTRGGRTFAVPLIWGDEPCVYNPKKWKGVPPKYTDFADPRYKGELVFLNDPYSNIWLFATSLNMPQPHLLTQKQLDQVIAAMLTVKPNIVAFGASLGDMADILIRGDASMAIGGWVFQAVIAAEKGVELRVASPGTDGTFFWSDAYAIALDAPDLDNAYAFIDFMMRPESNAAIASKLGSGATIEKAVDLIDKKLRDLHPYDIVRKPNGGILNTQIVIPPQEDRGDIVGAAKWAKAWEAFRLS
ncbi:MAG TPA: extracellular solute-binding protein [Bryobacteraceae bacterium]|nr:extracellular solute-binding protein [Bryobacteraceae bacterium]